MKYLIAIDSDGTLRHSDGNISDKTKKIIKKVVDCGNIVVICTARPRYYTLKISNEVGLNEYLISSNGTEIYDNVNKKNIYSTYLPKEECKIIYQETKKLGLRVMFVAENTEYVTMFTRNDSQILLDDNNAYILLKKEIKQIMIISKEKELVKKYKSSIEQKSNLCVVDSSNIINFFMCVWENASCFVPYEYGICLVLLNASTFIINSSSSPTVVPPSL